MRKPSAGEHEFHAEATALEGMLHMPLEQTIDPQASALLHPRGGYLSQKTGEFRLESVVTFKSAHTQVSGIKGVKLGHGHATLATAVVEGLNILEILTCDRVIAQIATGHPDKPKEGERQRHTPEIIFLGTRFENLRIAGHPVHVRLDLEAHNPQPPDDLHYIHEPGFLAKVASYCRKLRDHAGLPEAARKRYTGVPETIGHKQFIEYSLVKEITGEFPGRAFGHVIDVPHFGTIDLATVKITYEFDKDDEQSVPKTTVELKMLEVKMGCIGDGGVDVASAKTGGSKGGG